MNRHDDASDFQTVYSIRLHERAISDIDLAYLRFADLVSRKIANEWLDGIKESISDLSFNPRRFGLVPEKFNLEVRQILFRSSGSQATYCIIFTISGEEQDTRDAPMVTVLHVRHSVSRPISRNLARQIVSEE